MQMDMASATFQDDMDYSRGSGKTRGRGGKSIKGVLCMPKLGRRSSRPSTMSFLDRFREVVFRLVMLSAISKGTQHSAAACGGGSGSGSGGGGFRRGYYSQETYNSEALADCIEFIKKSASAEEGRDSVASADGVDLGPTAFPVM